MSARISECGQYRYTLTRGDEPRLCFVMLNPSTADATLDDPTIRRCLGFARREGCAGIEVLNLYALRATNPADLWKHADPVGPNNDWELSGAARRYTRMVAAWGANAKPERVKQVRNILEGNGISLYHLGLTKAGQPKHPLYLRADAPLEYFAAPTPARQA